MRGQGRVEHSVSTWRQEVPPSCSPGRAAVVDRIAGCILSLGPRRVRVGIDGFTAAGKTTLGHEVAHRVARAGRTVMRASLDDFKRPWRDADLYDRVSGEGYYRNAFDYGAARRLLLDPAAPAGSGRVALCSIDPLTQVDHSQALVDIPTDGVLIVDGVFAFRPELARCWDLRVWVQIDPELSVRRGTFRDAEMVGGTEQAEAVHRDRYLAAERIYLDEASPMTQADIVVDNTEFDHPRLVRW